MATELDVKPEDRLDKFVDHLLNKRQLTPNQTETLERYRKAFGWRCKMFSPNQTVQMLMKEYDINTSQAYLILQDATKLYGKVEEIDKEGTRKILIEHLYIALSIAVKDRNAEAIIKATERIAKLSRIDEDTITLDGSDIPARVVKYIQNNLTVNNYPDERNGN